MAIEIKLITKKPVKSPLHGLIVPSDKIDDLPETVDRAFLQSRGFEGDVGQILFTQIPEGSLVLQDLPKR